MKIIFLITLILLVYLFYCMISIDYYRSSDSSDSTKESSILSSVMSEDCSHYTSFINKPYNKAYYTQPRFKNPQKACQDECVYGVWNDNNKRKDNEETIGSEECCKTACKNIPNL